MDTRLLLCDSGRRRGLLRPARAVPRKGQSMSRASASRSALGGLAAGRRGRAHREGPPRARAPHAHRDHDRRSARARRARVCCSVTARALVGLVVGLLLPRAYLDYLVRGEARAADDDAPGSSGRWSTGRRPAGPTRTCSPRRPRRRGTAGCGRTSRRRPRRYYAARSRAEVLTRAAPPPGEPESAPRLRRSRGGGPNASSRQSAAGQVLATLGEAARANRCDRPTGGSREQGAADPGGDPCDRHPGSVPVPVGRQPRAHRGRSARPLSASTSCCLLRSSSRSLGSSCHGG